MLHKPTLEYFIAKDPRGWIQIGESYWEVARESRAGFSQHLECGIHRSESSPKESFALISHPVARWAKTTPK